MIRHIAAPLLALTLAACATTGQQRPAPGSDGAPVTVKIIGINDFHGHIEPPHQSVDATTPAGEKVRVPVGGAAWLASAIDRYRAKNPNTLVVGAGDLIGGTPIISSYFLDEPAIGVLNRIGLDFNAVGNHEFDRGRQELLRIQNGGCEKFTVRQPCQVEKMFEGAKFQLLAANVITENGTPLFPASAIRRMGSGKRAVTIGLIGLTLRDTPNLASPSGLVGLDFKDEADTINALIPDLKKQGAQAIVVLIHQGLYTEVGANDKGCGGVSGDLLKTLARLDPQVDLVVSGHTHRAYLCDYGKIDASRPFLVTSAGLWGEYFTDINLTIDPVGGKVIGKTADNIMVQSEAYTSPVAAVPQRPEFETFTPRADIAAYVARYADAVRVEKDRAIGKVEASTPKPGLATEESALGNMIADAQWAASRASGAQFALMNNTGVRNDLLATPEGVVTFGAIFAVQPFANELKTMTLSGAQLKALLEQQFDDNSFKQAFSPSSNIAYAYDLSRPAGQRVFDIAIDRKPLDPAADYRFTVNSFLASGGDSFTVLRDGRDVVTSGQDLDAFEAWINAVPVRALPKLGRVKNQTPADPAK